MDQKNLPWVNYDEAMARVRETRDSGLEQFVMRALTLVIQQFSAKNFPREPLDMLYFVGIMEELYQQKDSLVRVLNGEDLRWFGDESQ